MHLSLSCLALTFTLYFLSRIGLNTAKLSCNLLSSRKNCGTVKCITGFTLEKIGSLGLGLGLRLKVRVNRVRVRLKVRVMVRVRIRVRVRV